MRKMIVVLFAGLLLLASAGTAEGSVRRWIDEYRPGWIFPEKLPSAPVPSLAVPEPMPARPACPNCELPAPAPPEPAKKLD
jgi:hypothetical protein